jgi:hypothetical protein
MNNPKPATIEEKVFFILASRFRRTVARAMYREFPALATDLSNASVRREKDEALAWEIHDAAGDGFGGVRELMRDLPRLWEQNVDNDELAEWVKDAERLAKAAR